MEGNLVVYATSHNIKQFIGNGLLTIEGKFCSDTVRNIIPEKPFAMAGLTLSNTDSMSDRMHPPMTALNENLPTPVA